MFRLKINNSTLELKVAKLNLYLFLIMVWEMLKDLTIDVVYKTIHTVKNVKENLKGEFREVLYIWKVLQLMPKTYLNPLLGTLCEYTTRKSRTFPDIVGFLLKPPRGGMDLPTKNTIPGVGCQAGKTLIISSIIEWKK